jgi:hypothetical protein
MSRKFLLLLSLLALGACSSSTGDPKDDGGIEDGEVPPDGTVCVPRTCTSLASDSRVACGENSDGCGGTITCTDEGGESPCRGFMVCAPDEDGVNRCLHPGEVGCTPLTESQACSGVECGYVSDGCEGTIHCGGCSPGSHCTLGTCGATPCTPVPVGTACDGLCGEVSDGCSGTYACDDGNGGETCSGYAYCGWGGVPNECGSPPCVPTTCEELGFTCGLAPDGCGGALNCWPDPDSPQCPDPNQRCIGGIDEPAKCVAGDGPVCQGPLCDFLPECDGMPLTRLSGRVTTPDGELGVPNAIVYIPRNPTATLPAIHTGPSCERCEDEDLGPLLASAVTDYRGEFTLEGKIPVGAPFRVVVKAGKWRRVIEVPSGVSDACSTVQIGNTYTRLPANKNDGLAGTHMPLIAVATGEADAMECVLYKMGVDGAEFTTRTGDGRIHMYRANGARMCDGTISASSCQRVDSTGTGCGGSTCNASPEACYGCSDGSRVCSWIAPSCDGTDISVDSSNLASSNTTNGHFNDYDLVIWDCEGTERSRTTGQRNRVRDYVNAGGRFFVSHWSYDWLYQTSELQNAGNWREVTAVETDIGYISIGRPRANAARIDTFARWLHHEGAISVHFVDGEPTFGSFQIQYPRDVVNSVNEGADEWIFRTSNDTEGSPPGPFLPGTNTRPQQFSFNTPWGATPENVCGRVAFTGFHVAGSYTPGHGFFPGHCGGATMNTQEKTLAYMLFDLSACISEGEPPNPPDCTPLTQEEACYGGLCGTQSDGCGGVVECTCPGGEECIGGFCGGACPALTCEEIGASCGTPPDGCGGLLNCGSCGSNEVCGLYAAYQCGGLG